MRKIAKRLGISTTTVSKILGLGQTETKPVILDGLADRIVPKAFQTVEKAIDRGDANVAMRYLERTALAERKGDTYQFTGDTMLVQAVGMLPAVGPSTPSTPSLPGSTGTGAQQATEAAENPPGQDMSLSVQPNFLQTIDTATLEAELARRRAVAAPITAEIVDEP